MSDMADADLRAELIRAMREIPGPYYAWPSTDPEEDASVEEGDGFYAPGIGRVADAVLAVISSGQAVTPGP
jgi:hypothetical protein